MNRKRKPAAKKPSTEKAKLLHELEVHQVELEMQNEELRSARGALEGALERYTEVFDFAPIGYVALDEAGEIREINHAGSRLLGIDRAKLIGKRFDMFVKPRSRPVFEKLIASAMSKHMAARCELELEHKRAPVPARLTAAALRRGPTTVLLAFEDVSERIAKEAELARTAEALRLANRRKDDFLAMLSHELRNPLSPIRTSVDVLRLAPPGGETFHSAIDIIDRSAAHLTRLVGDLLDVTRIMRGKIELQREPLELSALVRRVVDDHAPSFTRSGVQLIVRTGKELWVEGDPARLVQVVSNVISNARKFTQPGGEVVVSIERWTEHAVIRVRDNGAGVPPDLIGQLFEPFVQGPQALDRERGGLGLGLAMVRALVELHGGKATIRSDGLGKGAEVTIELRALAPAPHRADAAHRRASRTWRILVIEDMPETAKSLVDALSLHGHVVAFAHDGRQGLEVAATFRPDAVLCDIGLPDIDGFEVARRLRATDALRDTYLVALSGYAQPEDVERAHAAGFAHHLAKPARIDEIERVLERAR
jgi:PAS domain S-box-containing protein